MAAVQHADDHFLADIAALGEADRARLDAGFERNRLLVHVAVKQRHAGLDAQRLGGLRVERDGAALLAERVAQRAGLRRDR